MRKTTVGIAFGAAFMLMGGCATITKDKSAGISFVAPKSEHRLECTLRHKKGNYALTVPGNVTVKKSDDPLYLECRDEQGKTYSSPIYPKRGAMAWGNIVFGGGIGAIVDANTDAHWLYPSLVTLPIGEPGYETRPPVVEYPGKPDEPEKK